MAINLLLQKVFGTRNQRLIKRMHKAVEQINHFEPNLLKLSDAELQAKTPEFKSRLQAGETLNQILPEAFAVVREASRRTLKLRHFDVQMIGGIVLHSGKIAEMRMGEGKTLVATLPVYLNALTGEGVHVVTVNDYLANRDAEWMSPIFHFLGMTVGVNLPDLTHDQKKAAYHADITYGTNNEFGFDYLRDNMSFTLEGRVQRILNYAVIDEVDSILIDEARTPLIISGMAEQSSELYVEMNNLIPRLVRQMDEKEGTGDYVVDEKTKQVHITETGHDHLEKLLTEADLLKEGTSLYDISNILLMHHLAAALRSHTLFQRDVDYIVKNGEVIIVDEHTGRLMAGRRWSDGLHQATEAKEGVHIKSENQTLASITLQNYFRLYQKLSGMTGTADTEAFEFQHIYGLEVVVIPTNRPVIRKDLGDQIYLTRQGKFQQIAENIKERWNKGQPILVGTTSIETSEYLSEFLDKEKIPHQVLNAKFHEQEAKIIAQAGRPGAVTIATNMAGRGTDIVLGGNLEAELHAIENLDDVLREKMTAEWQQRHDHVIELGGLHVLGTERNESRRIDNQLRGRSGRQGDPGSSQYYLSLEDNLMRIFAPPNMGAIMRRLGMKEDEAIENRLITQSIEKAQRKVEGQNFDMRKQLLEYDDVANDQRKVIYEQRRALLEADDVGETIEDIRADVFQQVMDSFIPPHSMEEEWNLEGLEKELEAEFGMKLKLRALLDEDTALHEEGLRQLVLDAAIKQYREKEGIVGRDIMKRVEKTTMLQTLDNQWREHLAMMDHLRKGIHLRGYAQKNPKQEYKREAFEMFTALLDEVKRDVIASLTRIEFQPDERRLLEEIHGLAPSPAVHNLQFVHTDSNESAYKAAEAEDGEEKSAAHTITRPEPKIGRNEPCPCGSGKKYKQCHGVLINS